MIHYSFLFSVCYSNGQVSAAQVVETHDCDHQLILHCVRIPSEKIINLSLHISQTELRRKQMIKQIKIAEQTNKNLLNNCAVKSSQFTCCAHQSIC